MNVPFSRFHPLQMTGSHALLATFVCIGLSRCKFNVKSRALACPVLEIYKVIDRVHHLLRGSLLLNPVTRSHAAGGSRPI